MRKGHELQMRRVKAISIIAVLSLIITGGMSFDFVDSELADVQDLSAQSSSFVVKTFSGLTGLRTERMTGMSVSGSNELVTFRSWESLATDRSSRSTSTGGMKTVTWKQQTTLRSGSEANSRESSGLKTGRKSAYIYPLNMSNHLHTLRKGNVSLIAVNGLNKPQKLRVKLEALQGRDYDRSETIDLEPSERRLVKIPISTTAGQDNYLFRTEIGTYNDSSFQPIYSRNFVLGKIDAQINMYLDGGVRGCVFTPSNHFGEWQRGEWLISKEKEVCGSRNKEMPVKFEQVNLSLDLKHRSWSGENSEKFDPVLKYRVDDTAIEKRQFNNSKAWIPEQDNKPGSLVTYWISLKGADARSSKKGYHVYSADVEANNSKFKRLEEFTNKSSKVYSGFETVWNPKTYFEEFKSRLTPDLGGGPVESSLKTMKFVYKRLKLSTTAPKDLDEVINYLKGLNSREMWIIIGNKPYYSDFDVLPDYPDTGYKVTEVFEELEETAEKQHETAEKVIRDGKVDSEDVGSLRRMEILLVHEKNQVEDAVKYIEKFEDAPDASKYTKHPLCGGKASIVVGCPGQREVSMVRDMSTQTLAFLKERKEMLNQSINKFEVNYTYVDADSPVDLHVYGPNGDHFGAVYNGSERIGFEKEIPGVSAFEVNGTVESVMIHNPRRDKYRIEVFGRANGSYDLEVETSKSGTTETRSIENIPTSEGDSHNISVKNTVKPKHQLKINTEKMAKAKPAEQKEISVNISNSGSEAADIELYSSSGHRYASDLEIGPKSEKELTITLTARNQSWNGNYSLNLIARSKYDIATTDLEIELNTEPELVYLEKNISINASGEKEIWLKNKGSQVAENVIIYSENDLIGIAPGNISYIAPGEELNITVSLNGEVRSGFNSFLNAESRADVAKASIRTENIGEDRKDRGRNNSSDRRLFNLSLPKPSNILQIDDLEDLSRSYDRILTHEKLLEKISSASIDYRRKVSGDGKVVKMETAGDRVVLKSNSSMRKKIYQNPEYRVSKTQTYKSEIWRIKSSKGVYLKKIRDGRKTVQNSVYNNSTVNQRFETLENEIVELRNVSAGETR